MTIYSISNKDIFVSVKSSGAELVSLKTGNTELLWQADKAVWPRYSPILFPVVGRLKDDHFFYGGEEFKMNQHGFARDKEFTLVEQKENILEFELTANEESFQYYPFHFSLRIRYELNGSRLIVKYFIFNPDNKPLIFSIGAHPGFSCKRIPGENISDYYLEIPGKDTLIGERLENGLRSGDTYEIKIPESRLDLSSALFENDALVLKNAQIGKIVLASKKSPNRITLECSGWPYFGVWTKKGSDDFVCLEPWFGISDPVNSDCELKNKEGIINLGPHAGFNSAFTLVIGS